jgi:hypothetical protein
MTVNSNVITVVEVLNQIRKYAEFLNLVLEDPQP